MYAGNGTDGSGVRACREYPRQDRQLSRGSRVLGTLDDTLDTDTLDMDTLDMQLDHLSHFSGVLRSHRRLHRGGEMEAMVRKNSVAQAEYERNTARPGAWEVTVRAAFWRESVNGASYL